MGDFKPRTRKTAEAWVKLFILARGRSPVGDEIPMEEFEDMVEESDEWRALRARIQVALGSSEEA